MKRAQLIHKLRCTSQSEPVHGSCQSTTRADNKHLIVKWHASINDLEALGILDN
jgi:hypothetical protein